MKTETDKQMTTGKKMATRRSAIIGQAVDETIKVLQSGKQWLEAVDDCLGRVEAALSLRARPPRHPYLTFAGRLAASLEMAADGAVDIDSEAAIRSRLYNLYTAMRERGQALENARRFQLLTGRSGDFRVRAQGLTVLAKACYWSDDQSGAVDFQRQALDIVEQAAACGDTCLEDEKSFNSQRTIWAFRFAQNTCRWEEAVPVFERAARAARSWNDPALLSDSLILYAEARMFQGEWAEAERLAHECARAAIYAHSGLQNCYPFWLWGRALFHSGNASRALRELTRAIRLARKTGDAVGLSEALISLAEAKLSQGDNDSALQDAELAERTAAAARLDINLAWVRLWRVWIEMQADSSLALRNIEPLHKSLATFENLGTLSGWVCTLHGLGHALALTGRAETAREYLELAREKFSCWNMHWHAVRADSSLRLCAG